jgi:hypothetical protein
MWPGRRWYGEWLLEADEWLQQVAGDMQSNRKENNEGSNKFETFFQK